MHASWCAGVAFWLAGPSIISVLLLLDGGRVFFFWIRENPGLWRSLESTCIVVDRDGGPCRSAGLTKWPSYPREAESKVCCVCNFSSWVAHCFVSVVGRLLTCAAVLSSCSVARVGRTWNCSMPPTEILNHGASWSSHIYFILSKLFARKTPARYPGGDTEVDRRYSLE